MLGAYGVVERPACESVHFERRSYISILLFVLFSFYDLVEPSK